MVSLADTRTMKDLAQVRNDDQSSTDKGVGFTTREEVVQPINFETHRALKSRQVSGT